MRRTLAVILCLCTLFMLTVAPLTSASAERSYQYINSYKNGLMVRLRPEPNTNKAEITKLPHRALVLVYQYNSQRTWAFVEADNPDSSGPSTVKGWVSTTFLSKKDPGPWKGTPAVSPAPTNAPAVDQLATLSAVCKKIKPVALPYLAEIKTKNPTSLVHLRWFPDTSARYVDAFPRGTIVTVIAKGGKWTQVMYTPADTNETHVGFVLSDNVQTY